MTTSNEMLVYDLSAAGSVTNADFSFTFSNTTHPHDTMTVLDSGTGTQDQTFSDDVVGPHAGVTDQVIQNDFLGYPTTGHYIGISNTFTVTGSDGSSFQMWGIRTDGTNSSNPIANTDYIFVSSQQMVPGVTYSVVFTTYNVPLVPYSTFAICFAKHTKIQTADGQIAVELLTVGQKVLTADNGLQTIRWIGHRKVTKNELRATPNLRPVCITSGSLGNNLPRCDLRVSPQHRMLVASTTTQRMFGVEQALISAKKLTLFPGIYVETKVEEVEYFHILFDRHEIVFAEGTPSESLYTGPEALKAVGVQARKEILSLFPELLDLEYKAEPARFIPQGRRQKRLVERHQKNRKDLLHSDLEFNL